MLYYIDQTSTSSGAKQGSCPGGGFKSIANGYAHSCAIATDDTAYCWGSNTYGQLGNGLTADSLTPVAVGTSGAMAGKTIKAISSSYFHTCAIASDNNAYCWGYNNAGQLGNGTTNDSSVPVAVNTSGALSGKTIVAISVGAKFTCVLASDNNAYCWGENLFGQLGNGSTTQSSLPVAVTTSGVLSGKTLKTVSSGAYHACAIASDNNAYCWGLSSSGQLGDSLFLHGSISQSAVPVAVTQSGVLSGKTIKAMGAGGLHTCVIASDNNVYCWGRNNEGQLGNGSTTQSASPVAVTTSGMLSGKTVTSLAVGKLHSCVIASDTNAYCWGDGSSSQLGNGTTALSSVPVAVTMSGTLAGKTPQSISATGNSFHTCIIASDNLAYCWGFNNGGQLGNNSKIDSAVPVIVNKPF